MELNYDESARTLSICPVNGHKNIPRRLRFYLVTTLGFRFDDADLGLLSVEEDERYVIVDKVISAFQKYNVVLEPSETIKTILHDYFSEEAKFKEFTDKAVAIWNNDVDKDDFSNFCQVLHLRFPSRILYDKQLLASYHLAYAQNACNFSVPGAGKTSVVYAAFAYLNSLPENHPKYVNKILVIGPLSSFGPWEKEYKECFGVPANSARLSGGVSSEERLDILWSLKDVSRFNNLILMSYQSISFNLDGLEFMLSRRDLKFMVVLDEAHKIKNVYGGVWAESALSLSKLPAVNSRVVLTGTPAPNGYQDIYNLYQFIWPNRQIIRYRVNQLTEMSANPYDDRIETLVSDIQPFFIRITKKDILPSYDYPVNMVTSTNIIMDNVQRTIYNYLEERFVRYVRYDSISNESLRSSLSKAKLIRLMQVATNPRLLLTPIANWMNEQYDLSDIDIEDQDVLALLADLNEDYVPPKYKWVGDLCKELISSGQKVIVWALFTQNLHELKAYLSKLGMTSKLLYGATPTGTLDYDDMESNNVVLTRERIIAEFHETDSGFKIIIANPFAVSESISLHKACHHAIYLEKSFNAAAYIQSKDRIHRVGLKKGVETTYHFALSRNSIDETIHRRLIEKELQLMELIERSEIPLISHNLDYLSDYNDDIKAIIRDYVERDK